ncbi:hypothetical protein MUP59_05190 [Candidatus Bathyarchaeota archaeon]|jgi:hypothetical protein|nr:hypothetical protein [Candidatus Bathyarchaeota archaeon]
MSPIEPLIDAIVAACFLFGAVFYLMVAYGERRGMAWRFLGTAAAIWFVILFFKLINNMAEFPWVYGSVRAAVALTLGIYLLGIILLARDLK